MAEGYGKEKNITDSVGCPIGKKIKLGEDTIITDNVGKRLGVANKNGTFDATGKIISRSYAPELLLQGADDEEDDD